MSYSIEILNEKAIKLLLYLEEMQLIRVEKQEIAKNPSLPQKKSFGGRIAKEVAEDWQLQLNEMRSEWERI